LAAELDMQAIYDLVGDQIRNVFDAQAVIITTYDYVNELTNIRYMVEKGERLFPNPIPISPLNKHLIKNRQPLLMETSQDFTDYGGALIDGSEYPKSGIFVPLIIGDSVRGSITLQNVDRESAYGNADVVLLSTLANSMSVALENARLFDETNQRAAELAIINSVGEAMAKQLDVETISRIVGDKVRDIFEAEATDILLYDRESGLIKVIYAYDRGYVEDPTRRARSWGAYQPKCGRR
jgi:GAF domain-containing protein